MDIDRLPYVGRRAFCLGLLGVAAIVAGCGDDQGSAPKPATEGKAKEDAEREARQKAFGPSGNPGKPVAKPKS